MPADWLDQGAIRIRERRHMLLYAQTWLPSGDNHFDRCDLLHHRIIHDNARKALAGLRISASRR
jgi:hypothetical protein